MVENLKGRECLTTHIPQIGLFCCLMKRRSHQFIVNWGKSNGNRRRSPKFDIISNVQFQKLYFFLKDQKIFFSKEQINLLIQTDTQAKKDVNISHNNIYYCITFHHLILCFTYFQGDFCLCTQPFQLPHLTRQIACILKFCDGCSENQGEETELENQS